MYGVDVHELEPFAVDFIMCDIGESDPNWKKEEQRTIRNLELLRRWLAVSPQADYVIKLLCPYGIKVLRMVEGIQNDTGRGRIVRCPASRNTSAEMYLVSGSTVSPGLHAMALIKTLERRMDNIEEMKEVIPGPILDKGTRPLQ